MHITTFQLLAGRVSWTKVDEVLSTSTIDTRGGGRGIGNGSYRRVSLFYSFVVPLMNLVCSIITWLKFLDVPT